MMAGFADSTDVLVLPRAVSSSSYSESERRSGTEERRREERGERRIDLGVGSRIEGGG
jgi:hypothetical protein